MIKWRVPNAVAKKPADVTPRSPSVPMNCRARSRQDGQAVQDWEQAEREIREMNHLNEQTQTTAGATQPCMLDSQAEVGKRALLASHSAPMTVSTVYRLDLALELIRPDSTTEEPQLGSVASLRSERRSVAAPSGSPISTRQ